ncbi:MAG TPA: ATP-binding protein [Thermoanaerobaculia bacterium]|jgi:two-component system sensor histidine kinase ChvG
MKLPLRSLSRLPVRLLAFNLLLVFLPVAGVLFLGEYERRLETAEIRAMTDQARLIAAAMAHVGTLDPDAFEDVMHRARIMDTRVRLIDATGRVVADSRRFVAYAQRPPRTDRHNLLYRFGAFLLRPIVRVVRPPEEPLEVDLYENAARLRGPEIANALRGREQFEKKITATEEPQRSVTLYRISPIVVGGWTVGAVVASKSTFTILQDLYAVRLRIMRVFIASLAGAILVSIFFSMTIVTPLRQLRVDARSVLDRRTIVRGHFKGSKRQDEIGELSRALERIMRRLDARVAFVESFAADVVHELKNPLASIRNANEMIADVNNPADRRRFVGIIDQEVARMERLLSGIREISMIDARLVREERHPVDLTALLTMIVDGFRLRAGDRVRIESQVPEQPVFVAAAEDRLIQVFENILDNALSFSPAGSTISVRLTADETALVTQIADQGAGIPEANLPRIFDRFFTHRPDANRHDARHTGLGLAIVSAIIGGYGGTISAANAERGAVFTVRLPRA